MNLTQIVRETGRRVRRGKMRREQLTNEQVKLVLENAVEVMREGLATEGRLEIQGFLVIERKVTPVKPTRFRGKRRKTERVRWVVRVK
jgi:nucleoid DNA-binding protein